MTLALILFLGTFLTPPVAQPAQDAAQPPAASASPSANQGSTAQTPPPPASPVTSPVKKPAAKKRRHKKTATTDCKTTTPPGSTETAGDPAGTGSAGTQEAPTNCPPSKTIVRHGGTSEPSIQLAGDQTSEQRNAVNQLLGSTDVNLKKLSGRQLSANQQDMVNQIKQFTQQSKSAMEGGDMERARTLAWKAQLLSEELANPGK